MLNTITDFIFTHAYMIINIIMVAQVWLLVTSLVEESQEEIGELVSFYEEEEDGINRIS